MSAPQRLSAAQAAARLGVKRATLYAYVSRGLLSRTVDRDGRTSLFDAAEIDDLRTRRRRPAEGEVASVISSAITRLDEAGPSYRGESVLELVAADVDFEQVADLLWQQPAPPDAWGLPDAWAQALAAVHRAAPGDTLLLDRLRITVAVLSSLDPLRHDPSPGAVAQAGRHLLIGYLVGLRPRQGRTRERFADDLWHALVPDPGSAAQRRCLNAVLVLLADHGLAASTFTVRIAASVRADPYSLVSTGLGTVGGVLHGGASDAVHRLLDQADRDGADVAVGRVLGAGQRLPGVGHSVYKRVDPREVALSALIGEAWADDERYGIVEEVRELTQSRLDLPLNIDFALGALTWLARIPDQSAQVFAIARTAGWLAHGMEELTEKPVRFRPVARYTGALTNQTRTR